jgi:hypothetical protein
MIRKNRFSERSYKKLTGVTRFDLSQVYRAPRRPVLVPAERWPGAARERMAYPPAGTAPAPLFRHAFRKGALHERGGGYVTELGTDVKWLRHIMSDGARYHRIAEATGEFPLPQAGEEVVRRFAISCCDSLPPRLTLERTAGVVRAAARAPQSAGSNVPPPFATPARYSI